MFQSTRPVKGATVDTANAQAAKCVSIHAPREGRDGTHAMSVQFGIGVSIHAPREGRDPRGS